MILRLNPVVGFAEPALFLIGHTPTHPKPYCTTILSTKRTKRSDLYLSHNHSQPPEYLELLPAAHRPPLGKSWSRLSSPLHSRGALHRRASRASTLSPRQCNRNGTRRLRSCPPSLAIRATPSSWAWSGGHLRSRPQRTSWSACLRPRGRSSLRYAPHSRQGSRNLRLVSPGSCRQSRARAARLAPRAIARRRNFPFGMTRRAASPTNLGEQAQTPGRSLPKSLEERHHVTNLLLLDWPNICPFQHSVLSPTGRLLLIVNTKPSARGRGGSLLHQACGKTAHRKVCLVSPRRSKASLVWCVEGPPC